MTQDRLAVEKCSDDLMSLSAMFTMLVSSTTISWQVRISAEDEAGVPVREQAPQPTGSGLAGVAEPRRGVATGSGAWSYHENFPC